MDVVVDVGSVRDMLVVGGTEEERSTGPDCCKPAERLGCIAPVAVPSLLVKDEIAQPVQPLESA